jgi:hypothetical protein
MLCSICARACVRVCIYFKRAKAKRIIAWRRSFLFVSKGQATETKAKDPNETNSKQESFVRNRSSSSDIENERYAHTVLLRAHNTRARVE